MLLDGGADHVGGPTYLWGSGVMREIFYVYALWCTLKGGRVMIAFFVNDSTVAFPLHLPTLKRQQFFGAVANSLGKIHISRYRWTCGAVWRQLVKRWMLAKGE